MSKRVIKRALILVLLLAVTAWAGCSDAPSSRPPPRLDPLEIITGHGPWRTALRDDLTLERGSEGYSLPRARRRFMDVSLPQAAGDSILLRDAEDEDLWVEITPLDVEAARGNQRANAIAYPAMWTATDQVLVARDRVVEELRVLHTAEAPLATRYRVRTGPTIHELRDTELIELVDSDGRVRFHVPRPFAIDASGRRHPVRLALEAASKGAFVLTVTPELSDPQFPVVVDPAWVHGAGWPEARVTAMNSVFLEGPVTVWGDIEVIDAGEDEIYSDFEAALLGATVYGSVFANAILMADESLVWGDASFNVHDIEDWENSVQGSMNSGITLPSPTTVPTVPPFLPGEGEHAIESQEEWEALEPGTYGHVVVVEGGFLELTGGVYNLASLNLGDGAAMRCLTPCEVRIAETLHAGVDSIVIHSGLWLDDVQLFVLGESPTSQGDPPAVWIESFRFVARIFAPNGTIRIDGTPTSLGLSAVGRLVARDIWVTQASIGGDNGPAEVPCSSYCDILAIEVEEADPGCQGIPTQAACEALCADQVASLHCGFYARHYHTCSVRAAGRDWVCDSPPFVDQCNDAREHFYQCESECAGTDDLNACTVDICDYQPNRQPTTIIDNLPVPDQTSCDDGNVCNGLHLCLNGTCTLTDIVDDNNPCTIDTCDPVTGIITHTPVPAGTSCDTDGDVCNGTDTCDANAVCQPGVPPSVDDGNPCTVDGCDPQTGVSHTPTPGAPCEDGDACNGAETCDAAGHCAPGAPQEFEDLDPLTIDVCDPSTGLVTHYPMPPGGGSFFEDARYLFEDLDLGDGIDPPQQGVTATIEPEHLAVVRGQVFDGSMGPMPGVTVRILQHDTTPGAPSYGHVVTDAQGWFQIAVNGGGPVTVTYEKAGHPRVQRLVHTHWRDYAMAPDVVLTPLSETATHVVLDGSASVPQVVRGPVVTDPVGSRQATVIFEPGTEAFLEFDDAPAEPASTLAIRATEFTVGNRGPDAMPGELPMASAYTYALELRADEAEAAGARQISFSKRAAFYLENFYQWPVGGGVPIGYYDAKSARWVPSQNGIVLEYLGDTNQDGIGELDVTGDGVADEGVLLDALDITTHERIALVGLYTPGQTLWRVGMNHFSAPDLNALLDLPEESCSPGSNGCDVPAVSANTDATDPCTTAGSVIECENQAAGHRVPIVGTPYDLVYQSNRVEGYTAFNKLRIPLTGPEPLPAEAHDIVVSIGVAGRNFWYRYNCQPLPDDPGPFTPDPECAPDSTFVFDAWDGRDAYGRLVSGAQVATVRIGYTYVIKREIPRCIVNNPPTPPQMVLCGVLEAEAASFGQWTQGGVLNAGTTYYYNWWNVALWGNRVRVPIGTRHQETMQLGGFAIDAVHYYDRVAGVLYQGDGTRRRVGVIEWTLEYLTGKWPNGGTDVEGGLALESLRTTKDGVDVGPDGTAYSAEGRTSGQGFIRRTLPDGTFDYLVGGTASGPLAAGFSGDGGPAKSAKLSGPQDVARAKDGSFYISDSGNHRIRKISAEGIIETVAGTGVQGNSPNATPGPLAEISYPRGIAVADDGSVYFVDNGLSLGTARVKRLAPDGRVWTVAGGGSLTYTNVRCLSECEAPCSEGHPDPNLACRQVKATEMQVREPRGIAVDDAGGVLFTTAGSNPYAWRIDASGQVQRFAGTGLAQDGGDGGHRLATSFIRPGGIDIGPDGIVYVAHGGQGGAHSRIRAILPDGFVTTVVGAGNGGCGFGVPCGLGGPATWADIVNAADVAVDPQGRLVIADSSAGLLYRTETHDDVKENSGGILVPSEDAHLLYAFDLAGRHLKTTDATLGIDLLTIQYDDAGRLVSLNDVDDRVTTFDYAVGNLSKITGPFGHETTFATDGEGRLVAVTQPGGGTHTFSYSSSLPGMVTGYRSPAWDATHPLTTQQKVYAFDASTGRLTSAGGPMAWSKGLARTGDEVAWTVELTDPVSLTTSYQTSISEAEQTRVVTDPAGFWSQTAKAHDATGSTLTLLDDTSVVTAAAPDPRFGMMAPVMAMTAETNGIAHHVSTARSVSLANPNDALSVQMLTESITVEGRTTSWTVDRTGSPVTATYSSAANRVMTTTLTAEGRPATLALPEQEPISFVYETSGPNKGRLLQVKQGTGALERTHELHYNAAGNLWKIEDALEQATYLEYDGKGRLTKKIFPDATEVRFAYDLNDNLLALAQPGAPATYGDDDVHRFFYDGHDRAIQYDPPLVPNLASDTIDWHRRADLSLDLVDFAPQGLAPQLDPSYDGSTGQLTSLAVTGGGTLTFAYYPLQDPAKQDTKLESIASSFDGVTLTYAYGGALLTEEAMTGPVNGAVAWEYDSDFRVKKETINADTNLDVSYAYADLDGLLTGAGAMTVARRPQTGAVETATLGSLATDYGFNAFGELSGIEVKFGQTLKYHVAYARDKLGRVACKTETVDVATTHVRYVYDAAGRLHQVFTGASACCAATPSPCTTLVAQYGYDANGNRTSYDDAVTTIVGTYDAQDRIGSYGTATYAFNAMGQLAQRIDGATTSYTYDAAGNLRQVVLPGATIDYVIDGRGRRVGKKVAGVLQKGWIYGDDLNPIAELAADGTTVTKRFVYAHMPHVPSYMVDVATGQAYLLVTDQLGSVRLVVSATTGAIAQEIAYDAWGQATLLQGTWDVQPFAFAGGLYDPDTALYRFGARDYDPEIGRWTAKDPILFGGRQLNLFLYSTGDPVNYLDPTGKVAWGIIAGAAVISAAVSAGIHLAFNSGSASFESTMGAAAYGAISGAGGASGNPIVAAATAFVGSIVEDVVSDQRNIDEWSVPKGLLSVLASVGAMQLRPANEAMRHVATSNLAYQMYQKWWRDILRAGVIPSTVRGCAVEGAKKATADE